MFQKCCNKRKTISYNIIHDPKPIALSNNMDKIIKNLLWYVPNIDSYQASKNELVQDKLYDDFSFTYILNYMGMDENKDVKWIEPKDLFDDKEWEYFIDNICCNCQKLIIVRQKNLSKTNDLLRCIRNCIAHGHFAIANDYIIGFNKKHTKKNPGGIKKAVIKIKPQLLLNALEALTSPKAKELLLEYAFTRIGYNVIRDAMIKKHPFNLLIEKNNRRYAIEIKECSGITYLHSNNFKKILENPAKLPPNTERVLFIDTSRVTKDARKIDAKNETLNIVDISQIKLLLKNPPVDILAKTI